MHASMMGADRRRLERKLENMADGPQTEDLTGTEEVDRLA
jgi:hypothetical protein